MTDQAKKDAEASFDHPCKQTCSGWRQGYEKGRAEAEALRETNRELSKNSEECLSDQRAWIAELKEENTRLKSEVESNAEMARRWESSAKKAGEAPGGKRK